MSAVSPLLAALCAALCGLLSGFGIGGGSLLMVFLTAVAGFSQTDARQINLLYFLPTAALSLIGHAKNRFIRWPLVLPAALAGAGAAYLASMLGAKLSESLLRKLFGLFLLYVGCMELFRKKQRPDAK